MRGHYSLRKVPGARALKRSHRISEDRVKRLTTIAGAAGIIVALLPASALAEPARTVELGPGKTASSWTASGSGVIADRGMYSGDGDIPYPQYNESGCVDGLHDCD